MTNDDLLDALADLQHDLGKYILLPISMLPGDATDDDVRDALRVALRETRTAPGGTRSAAEIWRGFLAEVGDALEEIPAWTDLTRAVDQALAWEPSIDGNAVLDRRAIQQDLHAVSRVTRRITEQLQESR